MNSAHQTPSKLPLSCGFIIVLSIGFTLFLKLGPALLATLALVAIGKKLETQLQKTTLPRQTISVMCAAVLLLLLISVIGLGSSVIQFIANKAHMMFPDFLEQLRKAVSKSSIESIRKFSELNNAEMVQIMKTWAASQSTFWMAMTGSSVKFILQLFFAGLISISLILKAAPSSNQSSFGLATTLHAEGNRFLSCFSTLLTAQLYVSLWNTSVTCLYVFIILPSLGIELPMRESLVIATFLLSFIPALGNVLANSIMVVLCLQFPPWVLILSLVYLITVHKMEYLINAKVLSNHYQASVAELLTCIVLGETLFSLPGLILMPVVYLYSKDILKRQSIW